MHIRVTLDKSDLTYHSDYIIIYKLKNHIIASDNYYSDHASKLCTLTCTLHQYCCLRYEDKLISNTCAFMYEEGLIIINVNDIQKKRLTQVPWSERSTGGEKHRGGLGW